MTKKQKAACRKTVKMWKWLAVHPHCDKKNYFEKFHKEYNKLAKLGYDNIGTLCFLCGAFSRCYNCPLYDRGRCDTYSNFTDNHCPVYAFLIADTVERALKEVTGGKE